MACKIAELPRGLSLLFAAFVFAAAAPADDAADASAKAEDNERARQFEDQIAPLLARHCLECHDSASKKGELDLSRKSAVLKGGESGAAIVPGKRAESLLWEYVESEMMPPEGRPRLADEEKSHLREWIEAGAVWSGGDIDPSLYPEDESGAELWLQRLTRPEYVETVRASVGVDVEADARLLLPPDVRADGFSNTAYNLNVDLAHVRGYAELARLIVSRMDVAALVHEFGSNRQLTDEHLRTLISQIGRRLLRGPLDEHELDSYFGLATSIAEEGGEFDEVVGSVVEAMLQSPRFIYRIERQRGDGTPRPLDDYEMASRMSYIIWGGPPDQELLEAADAGKLSQPNQIAAHARRMLEDPRAVERSAQFLQEWMGLAGLADLQPNPERFPAWTKQLADDMHQETLAFFKEVVWQQQRPLWDLFNAQVTFVTPALAAHYGLPRNVPVARDDPGLQALYTFEEGNGQFARSTAGSGDAPPLKIHSWSWVSWEPRGLSLYNSTSVSTEKPPVQLIRAIQASGAASLEVWITPGNDTQDGPARILTLSSGAYERNVTLSQDGDRYEVRFRTSETDGNGLPALVASGGTVKTRPTHVVFTRDASGELRLYVDGELQGRGAIAGDLSNWDEEFRLAVGNETTRDRPWTGSLHLAAIYNRALTPEEVREHSAKLTRYDVASLPARGGLLTQGATLTIGGDDASMVTRGLFILHDLLYSKVGSPPPGLDTSPTPSMPGLSQRDVARSRINDTSCGGCHAKFEPLAFALEKFDGLGGYQETDEHGNKLRDDGEIMIPGMEEPVAYQSSAEFMDLLAGSERIRMGIARKVTQFALGRPLVAADAPLLDEIHHEFVAGGGTYASLVTAIVTSDLVRMTQTEPMIEKSGDD